jgi:RND family efflux transporter MFP subunit
VTPQQIATCVPALQAWSTALTAAQKAVTTYASALTAVQKQLAEQKTASSGSAAGSGSTATGSTSGSGAGSSSGSSGSSGRTSSGPSGSTGSSGSSGSSGFSGSSGSSGASGSTGSSSSSASKASGTAGGSGSLSTEAADAAKQAKILGDQASITEAEQNLTQAQTNLTASTLTSPIGGVVGSIGITPGQTESPSTGLTIVGEGAATVTIPVPLAKLPSVKAGQTAVVTPPGLGQLTGSVTQISMLPASTGSSALSGFGASSSATVNYNVTVTLPSTPQTLASGTYATTTITTASAADVLTVPVSAVPEVSSGQARVSVLSNGALTSTTVTVGAVGGGRAEIRSGLNEGDQVVLADVQAALPTNNTPNLRGLTGPGGPGGGPVRFGTGGAGGTGGAAIPGGAGGGGRG